MKIRNRNLAKKGPLLFFLPSQAPIWVAFPQPLAADRGPVEGGRRWGNRDTLDTLVTRGTKEPLGTRETRETRETRGNSETRQARETRGTRETRGALETRGTRETRKTWKTRKAQKPGGAGNSGNSVPPIALEMWICRTQIGGGPGCPRFSPNIP